MQNIQNVLFGIIFQCKTSLFTDRMHSPVALAKKGKSETGNN